jgi:hypothetical protein
MAKLNTAVLTCVETKKVHISIVIILSIRAFPGHYKNQFSLAATFYQTFPKCNTFQSRLNTPERYLERLSRSANWQFVFLWQPVQHRLWHLHSPFILSSSCIFTSSYSIHILKKKKAITLCNVTNIFVRTFPTVTNIQNKQYVSENACFPLQVKPLILRKIWDLRSSGIIQSV